MNEVEAARDNMEERPWRRRFLFWSGLVGSVFVAAVGLALAIGGAQLVSLGGSPYYLLAGIGLVATGGLLATRRPAGGLVYGIVLLATLAWAIVEAGFRFWPLLPRVFAPAVLGILVFAVTLGLAKAPMRRLALGITGASVLLALGLLTASLPGTFNAGQAVAPLSAASSVSLPATSAGDWVYYGRDPGGSRFAPFQQIDKGNVGALEVAWTVRTGDIAGEGSEDQNTPMQVGDTVYLCTPTNIVIAVDADTGVQRWRHDPQTKTWYWNRCRGLGYYETDAARALSTEGAPALACGRRVILSTVDARLIALDAATGAPCPDFGVGGSVSLSADMGEIKDGFYFPTSAPTVAGDRIIIGSWVWDNQEVGEPSGVVRSFSAETGELIWAWDLGNPAITKLPPEGQTYTRGTPNVWSTPAFDPALGLVYLPTGNATPDFWGSHRSEAAEQYSASVVALDIATGRERWRFQTVHHDLWDYDVPAQPMLIDFPTKDGPVPALVQLTKRGQVFVLDRRTGAPLTPVEERPVPQKAEPGEWTAPTQPYSVGMPDLAGPRLTEERMWGVSPLDQMLCRIAFRSLRYEGDFTPPSQKGSLQYPGYGGGQNWGGGTFDASTGRLITTGIYIPLVVTLTPTEKSVLQVPDSPAASARQRAAVPYDTEVSPWLSPLSVPCLEPPHGTMTAIDLKTREIAWQVPIGTAESSGPLGMQSGLKIPIGTFGNGGAISTGSGLAFHAATNDPYLRAYDTATGKVLWEARLPVGVGGTPMTYVSPKTGRQFVVVSAGGARDMPERGDYVIAFALPDAPKTE